MSYSVRNDLDIVSALKHAGGGRGVPGQKHHANTVQHTSAHEQTLPSHYILVLFGSVHSVWTWDCHCGTAPSWTRIHITYTHIHLHTHIHFHST